MNGEMELAPYRESPVKSRLFVCPTFTLCLCHVAALELAHSDEGTTLNIYLTSGQKVSRWFAGHDSKRKAEERAAAITSALQEYLR